MGIPIHLHPFTLWESNIGVWKIPPFIDDFPIETFIYRGFPSHVWWHRRGCESSSPGLSTNRPSSWESTKEGFSARWQKMTWITATWSNPQKTQLFDCDWKWRSPNLWRFRWWHIYDQWSKSAVLYFQPHPKAPIVAGIEMFAWCQNIMLYFACSRSPTRWKRRLLQEVLAEIRPWIGSLSNTADSCEFRFRLVRRSPQTCWSGQTQISILQWFHVSYVILDILTSHIIPTPALHYQTVTLLRQVRAFVSYLKESRSQ